MFSRQQRSTHQIRIRFGAISIYAILKCVALYMQILQNMIF